MNEIERYDINEDWAHSGIIKAGDLCFLNYCVGNVGGTLEHVVQMNCLFSDIFNIPVMEKVVKERFAGKYPARKSIQTEFADELNRILFQVDAIAYLKE